MQNLKTTITNKKFFLAVLGFIAIIVIFSFYKKTSESNAKEIEVSNEPNEVVKTLDKFDDKNKFKFAIIGDAHYKERKDKNFNKAIDFIEDQKVDLVLTVGDNLSSCKSKDCKKTIKNWKKDLKSLSSKIFITLGNHDVKKEKVLSYWKESFNLPENGPEEYKELVYSFNYGNSHFVVLESDIEENVIDDKQLNWLENDLKNNKKSNTFVFYHEPAFPIKSKVDESLDVESKQRNKLWRVIDKYKVTAVFSGHEHLHSRRLIDKKTFPEAKNSIYQFIVGNTNYFDHEHEAPKKLSDVSGLEFVSLEKVVLIVELEKGGINVKLYSVEGKLLDDFKLR